MQERSQLGEVSPRNSFRPVSAVRSVTCAMEAGGEAISMLLRAVKRGKSCRARRQVLFVRAEWIRRIDVIFRANRSCGRCSTSHQEKLIQALLLAAGLIGAILRQGPLAQLIENLAA